MNDEDFARHAFAAAFRSGQTGEPPTLPDVELLARHGRSANRNRHGAYVVGTTALAGAAVVGVVTGPSLLGLGSPSTSGIATAGQGPVATTPSPSPSASKMSSASGPVNLSNGVPCATPSAVNWLSIINGVLPAGVTAKADQPAKCVQTPDGSRDAEASFKLSTGDVELQVNVGTGSIVAKLGAGTVGVGASAPESLDPATLAQLRASKIAAVAAAKSDSAGGVAPSTSTSTSTSSLDAAAIASLQAQKHALASAAATASPEVGTAHGGGIQGGGNGTCSATAPDENTCISHVTKGSVAVIEVAVTRGGSSPLTVDLIASNGMDDAATPAPGQLPSDATMLALARAVAAHF
jgi:hypothetical protein